MADQLKRLNTFVAASTLRKVKVFAAENEIALGPAVEILLCRGLVSEPVETVRAQPKMEPLVEKVTPKPTAKVSPDAIVRCERCGAELPESARAIHEQNCATAQQGYWDRTSFRS